MGVIEKAKEKLAAVQGEQQGRRFRGPGRGKLGMARWSWASDELFYSGRSCLPGVLRCIARGVRSILPFFSGSNFLTTYNDPRHKTHPSYLALQICRSRSKG